MLAGIGGLGGLLAGLLGIGGGVVMAPLLLFTFEARGMEIDAATLAALATSTAAIVFTATLSTTTHALHGAVNWRQLVWLVPFAAIGALVSTEIARLLPTVLLMAIMAVYLGQSGWRMLRVRPRMHDDSSSTSVAKTALLALGFIAGIMGPLTGTGGGIVISSALASLQQPLIKAIGTSAGVTLVVASFGSLGWASRGAVVELSALAVLAPACVVMTPVGARWANVLSIHKLRIAYIALMLVITLRLLYSIGTTLLE